MLGYLENLVQVGVGDLLPVRVSNRFGLGVVILTSEGEKAAVEVKQKPDMTRTSLYSCWQDVCGKWILSGVWFDMKEGLVEALTHLVVNMGMESEVGCLDKNVTTRLVIQGKECTNLVNARMEMVAVREGVDFPTEIWNQDPIVSSVLEGQAI